VNIKTLAKADGLIAHAMAVEKRIEKQKDSDLLYPVAFFIIIDGI
jgi:hypothetical protein